MGERCRRTRKDEFALDTAGLPLASHVVAPCLTLRTLAKLGAAAFGLRGPPTCSGLRAFFLAVIVPPLLAQMQSVQMPLLDPVSLHRLAFGISAWKLWHH